MQLERVRHNQGQRNARLWKKLNNVPFNYFITVTYDSKKHTEESFRKTFTNFLKHAVNRKNWRYIGVWERGNGETWSCGTGAAAAVVAAVLNGYCDRDTNITVKLRGGDLVVNYHSNGEVELMGSVKTVYEGKFEI